MFRHLHGDDSTKEFIQLLNQQLKILMYSAEM